MDSLLTMPPPRIFGLELSLNQTKVLSNDLLRFFLSVAGGDGERRLLYVFFSRFLSASHIAINYNTSNVHGNIATPSTVITV